MWLLGRGRDSAATRDRHRNGRVRIGILLVTGRLVLGIVRRAQPRNDLLGPTGVMAILGFVASILAVSLPTSFALKAAGVRYPATAGILLAGVLMVVGGPLLMRYLRRLMLEDRAGGPE